MSVLDSPTPTVVLRCQEPGCGHYTRFEVKPEDLWSDRPTDDLQGLQGLSPAFWARAHCEACGGVLEEGVMYRSVPERRAYRSRARGVFA